MTYKGATSLVVLTFLLRTPKIYLPEEKWEQLGVYIEDTPPPPPKMVKKGGC
jgi:hypothetical protein